MNPFDVQSIGVAVSAERLFKFIAEPANLPKWTNAFKSADNRTAELATPDGAVPIKLKTEARKDAGSVDWIMTFPDKSVGYAYSRVTQNGEDASIYSFVLMAPPAPLEMLEGALDAQKPILAEELKRLKALMEAR